MNKLGRNDAFFGAISCLGLAAIPLMVNGIKHRQRVKTAMEPAPDYLSDEAKERHEENRHLLIAQARERDRKAFEAAQEKLRAERERAAPIIKAAEEKRNRKNAKRLEVAMKTARSKFS